MIPITRPWFGEEEIEEIKSVLESGWVAQGPKVKELEKIISDYVGVKYAVVMTNCTSALHLSLLALGICIGDEVIVADYTFPATGHSVMYCGATPRFCDVDPRTYNINVDKIEEMINPKTRAIIPVHTFGQMAEMNRIVEIAEEYSLIVIEDAACALGAEFKGRMAGEIGDCGCFSFHATKGVTTGEGGAAVTNDEEIANKIRHLATFGMTAAWDRKNDTSDIPIFSSLGYNYKMSDISAAVGCAQMKKIDGIIKRKQYLARIWDKFLTGVDSISAPFKSPGCFHVYQRYVTMLDPEVNRNNVIKLLNQKGIQAMIGTYASHIQPVYKSNDGCPNSLDVYNQSLALPLYYDLKKEEIDYIAGELEVAIRESKK